MLDPDRLPMSISELPEVFSPFRRKVEKQWSVPEPLPTPKQLPPLPDAVEASDLAAAFFQAFGASTLADDPRCSFRFTGGTAAAEERLRRWIWDEDRLRRYKDTRNGMLGADFSSRFSPWLADGSLSARRVDAAIRHYEQERVANESTYWLRFEMLWRDFFQFLAAKHPRSLFHRGGLAGRDPVDRIHGPQADAAFRQWCEGRTGDRLVDACMRELAATGWMSNRGRQNAASFLIHDLGVDWRRGAAWFEHLLVDYDPASNAGNWSSIAGLGRKAGHRFDTDRQAWTYDRKDRFQNHWLTEQPWT
jgi:deoxyribodipyrimidine photo-lyase